MENIELDFSLEMNAWRELALISNNFFKVSNIQKHTLITSDAWDNEVYNRVLAASIPEEAELQSLDKHFSSSYFIQPTINVSTNRYCQEIQGLVLDNYWGIMTLQRNNYLSTKSLDDKEIKLVKVKALNEIKHFDLISKGFSISDTVVNKGFLSQFKNTISHKNLHFYVLFEQDIPVASGLIFVFNKKAWLGWGSVLPQYREKSNYTQLLNLRIQQAWELGCDEVYIETHDLLEGQKLNQVQKACQHIGFSGPYWRPSYLRRVT